MSNTDILTQKYSGEALKQDLGDGGQGSVDLISGALSYKFTDIQTQTGLPKINIEHVYSSRYANADTVTFTAVNHTGMQRELPFYKYDAFGAGWRLNLEITINRFGNKAFLWNADDKLIQYQKTTNVNRYLYKLSETYRNMLENENDFAEDFTVGWFANKDNPKGGLFFYNTAYGSMSTSPKKCFYFDETGNIMEFSETSFADIQAAEVSTYRLTGITDAEGNKLNITFDSSGKHIASVSNSEHIVELHYSQNGKLASMSCRKNQADSVDYTGFSLNYYIPNNMLSSVSRVSGTQSEPRISFTYDNKGNMTSANNLIGLKYVYDYSDQKINKVTRQSGFSKISQFGNTAATEAIATRIDIDNASNTTYVTSHTGVKYIYRFIAGYGNYYYTFLKYEAKPGSNVPKDFVLMQSGIHDKSIFVESQKNNYLQNPGFEETSQDDIGWKLIKDSEEIALQTDSVNYVEGSKALRLIKDGDYVVSQSMENTVIDSMRNIYKFEDGNFSYMLWFLFDRTNQDILEGGNHFNVKITKHYENADDHSTTDETDENGIYADITSGDWQCDINTFEVKKTLLKDDKEYTLKNIELSIECNLPFDVYLDNLSFVKGVTAKVQNQPRILVFNPDSEQTYLKYESEIENIKQDDNDITKSIKDCYFEESYSESSVQRKIKFKDGSEFDLKYSEIVYGESETNNDAGQIVKTIIDADKNTVGQNIWNFGGNRDENNAFKTDYVYDNKYRLIRTSDYRNTVKSRDYSTDSQTDNKIITDTLKSNAENSQYIRTESEYSSSDVPVSDTDELGEVTLYDYSEDRPVKIILPHPAGITDEEIQDKYTVTYSYDAMGRLHETSQANHTYTYSYTLGLMTKAESSDGTSVLYEYDGNGNIIKVTKSFAGSDQDEILFTASYHLSADYSDAQDVNYFISCKKGITTKWVYDKYGNETAVYEGADENNLSLIAEYSYDEISGELNYIADSLEKVGDKPRTTAMENTPNIATLTCVFPGVSFDTTPPSDISSVLKIKVFSRHDRTESIKRQIGGNVCVTEIFDYQKDAVKGVYPDNRLNGMKIYNANSVLSASLSYSYDDLGRVSGQKINSGYSDDTCLVEKTYHYKNDDVQPLKTSNAIDGVSVSLSAESLKTQYDYAYDKNGNITQETVVKKDLYTDEQQGAAATIKYSYDDKGRIIREDNQAADTSTIFSYDDKGNILLKATVPYTLGDISVDTNMYYPLGTYLSDSTYCGEQFLEDASPFYSFDENKVKLFSYDSFGRLVKINNTPFASYDSFGRPVSYNGNILSWYAGNLKSFGDINLYYDLSGRRIKKVNGNKVTHYLYDEQGRLLREKFDGSDVPYITYMYDSSGAVGFMLPYAIYDLGKRHINERPFYYVKDLTGNIRRIVDSNGKCVIKYDYDAWGRVISAEYSDTLYTVWENAYFNAYSIGQLNSLIYKDYYYDKDLELYYLQTRYYDPTVCRFISPDHPDYLDYESINGLNLYAYCLNNPVMYADPTGHFAITSLLLSIGAALIAGAIAGVIGQGLSDIGTNVFLYGGDFSNWQFSSWEMYLGSTIGGAIGGALSLIPYIGQYLGPAFGSFLSTSIGMSLENINNKSNYSICEILLSSLVSGFIGLLSAGIIDVSFNFKGINVGSHSFKQVFLSGLTKNKKFNFHMSLKTFVKGVIWHLVEEFTISWLLNCIIEGILGAYPSLRKN